MQGESEWSSANQAEFTVKRGPRGCGSLQLQAVWYVALRFKRLQFREERERLGDKDVLSLPGDSELRTGVPRAAPFPQPWERVLESALGIFFWHLLLRAHCCGDSTRASGWWAPGVYMAFEDPTGHTSHTGSLSGGREEKLLYRAKSNEKAFHCHTKVGDAVFPALNFN